ncbi:MAG: beta-hydroxyacyl-ACP dehydratase [Chlorobiaceae bacterium]|nr:beta-hydroxyacyl-ACP dehydratase [Chlorobiaceae bacterium]
MRWLLIDKILEMEPGKKAVAVKCFSRSELFFMDHFPEYPIVPGVLQIEMIAQLAGKCLMANAPLFLPVLTSVKSAKFRKAIQPGDKAFIYTEVAKRPSFATAIGRVEVDGIHISSAEVMFGYIPIPENMRFKAAGNSVTGNTTTEGI